MTDRVRATLRVARSYSSAEVEAWESGRGSDDLNLEPLLVLQEQGDVLRSAGVGVAVGEQLVPTLVARAAAEVLESGRPGVQSEVVQPWPTAVVGLVSDIGRLLHDEVAAVTVRPASAAVPRIIVLPAD